MVSLVGRDAENLFDFSALKHATGFHQLWPSDGGGTGGRDLGCCALTASYYYPENNLSKRLGETQTRR